MAISCAVILSLDPSKAGEDIRKKALFCAVILSLNPLVCLVPVHSRGYFIQPTFVQVTDPSHRLMQEEIFGPVVAAYVYDDECVAGIIAGIMKRSLLLS